jgi:hypothetical protein
MKVTKGDQKIPGLFTPFKLNEDNLEIFRVVCGYGYEGTA